MIVMKTSWYHSWIIRAFSNSTNNQSEIEAAQTMPSAAKRAQTSLSIRLFGGEGEEGRREEGESSPLLLLLPPPIPLHSPLPLGRPDTQVTHKPTDITIRFGFAPVTSLNQFEKTGGQQQHKQKCSKNQNKTKQNNSKIHI